MNVFKQIHTTVSPRLNQGFHVSIKHILDYLYSPSTILLMHMLTLIYPNTFPQVDRNFTSISSYKFFLEQCLLYKTHYSKIYSSSMETNGLLLPASSSNSCKPSCKFVHFISSLKSLFLYLSKSKSTSQESILRSLHHSCISASSTSFNLVLCHS